jgi:hypothetical protein
MLPKLLTMTMMKMKTNKLDFEDTENAVVEVRVLESFFKTAKIALESSLTRSSMITTSYTTSQNNK